VWTHWGSLGQTEQTDLSRFESANRVTITVAPDVQDYESITTSLLLNTIVTDVTGTESVLTFSICNNSSAQCERSQKHDSLKMLVHNMNMTYTPLDVMLKYLYISAYTDWNGILVIEFVHSWPHLATRCTYRCRTKLISQINNVLCSLHQVDSIVKVNLLKT